MKLVTQVKKKKELRCLIRDYKVAQKLLIAKYVYSWGWGEPERKWC